jgi:transcriptional regulator with XRE-family HTH domain
MKKNHIGQKLVQMRKQAGLTQDELSEATGISQGHISYIEKSGDLQSVEHVRNLAAAYNMEPSDLMKVLYDKPKGEKQHAS